MQNENVADKPAVCIQALSHTDNYLTKNMAWVWLGFSTCTKWYAWWKAVYAGMISHSAVVIPLFEYMIIQALFMRRCWWNSLVQTILAILYQVLECMPGISIDVRYQSILIINSRSSWTANLVTEAYEGTWQINTDWPQRLIVNRPVCLCGSGRPHSLLL